MREVHSPGEWNSPVFVVQDASGKLRVVQDFRELNSRSQELQHPLPNLRGALNMAARHRFFTVLDLSSGFHQMMIDEASRPLTRFSVGGRSFEWNVLPMGVASAPAWFHSFLYSLVGNIEGVCVYIDDILVAGRTVEEHNTRLKLVQRALEGAGVCINPSKVQGPAATSVKYLGHQVSEDCIAPLSSYIDQVAALPPPKTVRQVRKALGAINWIADFLQNFRQHLAPLQRLTSGKFQWGEEQETAWKAFKKIVSSWQPLCAVTQDGDLELSVDASDAGWGGVLLQWNRAHTERRLVGCTSGSWDSVEKAWHVREKELKAVLRCLRKWRVFVYGRSLLVRTDHKSNLSVSLQPKNVNFFKLCRWVEELTEFNLRWEFTAGVRNGLPDWLSRLMENADGPAGRGGGRA